ncbi:MAG: metal-dependent hydrolase [Bdellovibrionota bacterium]
MDNVTHTLMGIAAAEAVLATRQKKARIPLWVASAVANNLPDLDVFFTWGRPDRLTYMLFHRGYTHTLVSLPLQSLLWLLVLRFWWRNRNDIPWRSTAALCFLGPPLHLFADAWNSYGVHPFWPFDNRWYYGDLVFILEPWLWVVILPPVWKRCSSTPGKAISLGLLALLLGLSWYHPYVAWPVALALTVFSAAWLAAQGWIKNERARIAGIFTMITLLFGVLSWAELGLKTVFAGEGAEIAAIAAPGNPFCWTMLSAGFSGNEDRAAAWAAAPWPSLVPASACPVLLRSHTGLIPLEGSSTPARIPLGQFRGTRAQYDQVVKSCRARAYLRFARIPVWKIDGEKDQLGDLRFGSAFSFGIDGEAGPAEICPIFEPPWVGRFHPSQL